MVADVQGKLSIMICSDSQTVGLRLFRACPNCECMDVIIESANASMGV
jgi:hypothetical protein